MSPLPYEKLLPRLNYLTFFEPGSFRESDKPDILDDGSWVIEGEFGIYDQKVRDYNDKLPFYKKKVGNKDGDTGYVYPILVCSEDFAKKHYAEIATETVKPIILDEFSREEVEKYITNHVQALGEVTFDELIECLDKFSWATYDFAEWTNSTKQKAE